MVKYGIRKIETNGTLFNAVVQGQDCPDEGVFDTLEEASDRAKELGSEYSVKPVIVA
jgi:hypothetical protein